MSLEHLALTTRTVVIRGLYLPPAAGDAGPVWVGEETLRDLEEARASVEWVGAGVGVGTTEPGVGFWSRVDSVSAEDALVAAGLAVRSSNAATALRGTLALRDLLARDSTAEDAPDQAAEASATSATPETETPKGPRVLARFIPQAWINDYAVEIDGAENFDVTDQIEAMGPEKAARITDYSEAACALFEAYAGPVGADHNGPYDVVVEDAIADYLEQR